MYAISHTISGAPWTHWRGPQLFPGKGCEMLGTQVSPLSQTQSSMNKFTALVKLLLRLMQVYFWAHHCCITLSLPFYPSSEAQHKSCPSHKTFQETISWYNPDMCTDHALIYWGICINHSFWPKILHSSCLLSCIHSLICIPCGLTLHPALNQAEGSAVLWHGKP